MLRFKLSSAAAVLLLSFPTASRADLMKLCDFQPNIDYDCRDCTPASNQMPVALFNYPGASGLNDLSQIEFTVSMQVGDPATSNLTLGIDGIDTGIALTGFERDNLVEKTFTMNEGDANWLDPGKEAELLNALKDGEVFASIIGADVDDLKVQLYSDTEVSLCITGNGPETVPEPASMLVWAAAAGVAIRRRRV
jgi:hypothetical protein